MITKKIRQWKKVFEADLGYIAYELKDIIDSPAVLIVNGEMGAGKTTFIKKYVESHEINAATMSPSYSVLSETPNILHGDFYRIESSEEILHLELELYLDQKQCFFVEWGEKYISTLAKEVPEDYSFYRLKVQINSLNSLSNRDDNHNQKVQSRDFVLEEISEID
jgi:tRNA threonylcarbamoyladenosine biosynthesis protein TsaE